ncbi:hypothetical protein EDB89DRAFT_1849273, partial [Lactarius sanguifluus]
NAILINYLHWAMNPLAKESTVSDFTIALLQELGYKTNVRLICSRVVLPYWICGIESHTNTNIGVFDCAQNDFLHLIQENKCLEGNLDPHAQLIAEAIATFGYNNLRWQQLE